MTAKEYLQQIKKLDRAIQIKREQIEEIKESLYGHAISYDKPVVQTSPTNDQLINTMARIEKLSVDIESIKNKRLLTKHNIICQIESLENDPDGKYMQILYDRYINYKPLDRIADEMGYDYNYVRRLHGWALQRFYNQYLK